MVRIDPKGLRYCKNVLPTKDELLTGYRYLHLEEAIFTLKAMEAMPAAVANWYGYLALFVDMLRVGFECPPETNEDTCNAFMLRAHLTAAGCATSKLALDATLSGHYAQAFGLMRHMLETWMHAANIRLDESVAKRWMGSRGGVPVYMPSYGTVVRSLKRHGKTEPDKTNIARAESLVDELHDGAHPSRILVAQLRSDDPGIANFAGNLNLEMLASAMSRGTLATVFLIIETERLLPFKEQQWPTFQRLSDERRLLHEAEGDDQSTAPREQDRKLEQDQ